ncbi:MAG TPA: nuclear transport factor 2 family protein [Sphingomonas sp.]|nr:nuclear transport factor 2 family protein [Sphingomonas sp.]
MTNRDRPQPGMRTAGRILRGGFIAAALASIGGTAIAASHHAAFSTECPAIDGVTPSAAVRATIEQNEQALMKAILAGDKAALDGLMADAVSIIHENGQVSTKQEFFRDYLAKGYAEATLTPKMPARQFCSTVFTVGNGYLRVKGEGAPPETMVTHIWARQGDRWVLIHRQESHRGLPMGKQLPQTGAANNTGKVGAAPAPDVAKTIAANQAAWVAAMTTKGLDVMNKLMNDTLVYVHVVPFASTKEGFIKELMGGYSETELKDTTMRQFGNTVLTISNAHYRHTGLPDQSRSMVMHAWVKIGDNWQIVARHGTHFANY